MSKKDIGKDKSLTFLLLKLCLLIVCGNNHSDCSEKNVNLFWANKKKRYYYLCFWIFFTVDIER